LPDALALLALLADEGRRRVVAALVLGAATEAEVLHASGLDDAGLRRAVDRLVRGGLVGREGAALVLRAERIDEVVRAASRAARAQRVTPEDLGATPEQVPVLRNFVVDGRLTRIPAARGKRRVVLEFLSMQFEPGRIYPERDVNAMLSAFFPDYAALRRFMVDEELLERRDGFYWRSGGPVDLDDGSG
jgi:hypothetical protein